MPEKPVISAINCQLSTPKTDYCPLKTKTKKSGINDTGFFYFKRAIKLLQSEFPLAVLSVLPELLLVLQPVVHQIQHRIHSCALHFCEV